MDDFAAGPAGTTVIAAELIYGPRLVKDKILTYDSSGGLRTALDSAPYSAEAITVDDQGNIFLLGERTNQREGDPPYPLLVKYDPGGRVIWRAIASNLFKSGSDAIQSFGPGNQQVSASVTLQDENLYVYAPNEKEVLVCSLDGKILRRAKVDDVSGDIARADKVHRAAIADMAFLDKNQVVLYLTEYVQPDDPQVTDFANMRTAAYLVDLTTKKFKLILRGESSTDPIYLGTKGKQLLTLAHRQQGFEIQAHDLF